MSRIVRIKTFYCGQKHVECEMFFSTNSSYLHRKARQKLGIPTTQKQKKSNERNSLKKLRRIVKSNFSSGEDKYVSLTYNNKFLHQKDEDAVKEIVDFKERLKDFCKRMDIELRLLAVTERGKNGRLHHHAFINREVPTNLILKAWSKQLVKGSGNKKESIGHVKIDKVPSDVDNIECISEYTMKCPLGKHKWVQTRNLIQPEVDIEDDAVSPGEFAEIGYGGFDRNQIYLMLCNLYPDFEPMDYEGTVIEALNNSPYVSASLQVKTKEKPVDKDIQKWCDKYDFHMPRPIHTPANEKVINNAIERWIQGHKSDISVLSIILSPSCREFMARYLMAFVEHGMTAIEAAKILDRQVLSKNKFSHVLLSFVGEKMKSVKIQAKKTSEIKPKMRKNDSSIKKWCDKFDFHMPISVCFPAKNKMINSAINQWIQTHQSDVSVLPKILTGECRGFIVQYMSSLINGKSTIKSVARILEAQVSSLNTFSKVLLSYISEEMSHYNLGGV